MSVHRPAYERRWLTLREAAKHCGYSPKTFRKHVKEYEIPRHGPEGKRFDIYELDEWMRNPYVFILKKDIKLYSKAMDKLYGKDRPLTRLEREAGIIPQV